MAGRSRMRGSGVRSQRVLSTSLLTLIIAATIGIVTASPLALGGLGGMAKDWDRLSLIGQTYGAASALLSVLALIGISVSLILQARENKANREQALRVSHTDLMRKAMEDPLYARVWGALTPPGDFDSQREHMYVNLIISHWEMEYGLGAITEEHLRAIARGLFAEEAGRRYWRFARPVRMISSMGRREERFHRILDEEFTKAHDPSEPIPHAERTEPTRTKRRLQRRLLVAVVIAAVVGYLARDIRQLFVGRSG